MALIAGIAGVAVLSIGQANTRLSQVNQESLLARQIAQDIVEFYSVNFAEAKALANSVEDFRDIFESHAAFRESLDWAPETRVLFKQMNPRIHLRFQYNVEVPAGSGTFYSGLHRLVVIVEWTESFGNKNMQWVAAQRFVSEIM